MGTGYVRLHQLIYSPCQQVKLRVVSSGENHWKPKNRKCRGWSIPVFLPDFCPYRSPTNWIRSVGLSAVGQLNTCCLGTDSVSDLARRLGGQDVHAIICSHCPAFSVWLKLGYTSISWNGSKNILKKGGSQAQSAEIVFKKSCKNHISNISSPKNDDAFPLHFYLVGPMA